MTPVNGTTTIVFVKTTRGNNNHTHRALPYLWASYIMILNTSSNHRAHSGVVE